MAALLALEALLDHEDDDCAAGGTVAAIDQWIARSEGALFERHGTVRALFTWSNLADLLLVYAHMTMPPRVTALFAKMLVAPPTTLGALDVARMLHAALVREQYALATAIAAVGKAPAPCPVYTHVLATNDAQTPRIAPTREYCDFLARATSERALLVLGAPMSVSWCRLQLALSLHHPLALEWLAYIRVLDVGAPWHYNKLMQGVVYVSSALFLEVLGFAAHAGHTEFLAAAAAKYPSLRGVAVAALPTDPARCPFTTQHYCCDRFTPRRAAGAA